MVSQMRVPGAKRMAWRFRFLPWRWCSSTSLPSGFREPAGLSRSHRHDSGDPALWALANPRNRLVRSISQGGCEYSVGHDWTLGARDPGRADHVSLHAGPGVREWHGFYPELFW